LFVIYLQAGYDGTEGMEPEKAEGGDEPAVESEEADLIEEKVCCCC
jgi:hypothetical protein